MTQAQPTEMQSNGRGPGYRDRQALGRTLMWIGVAGLSAALTFALVRALVKRRPADPTSLRIQQLIDEANTLLKTLDDQKSTG
ncbi:MAG: hypothetical protein ACYDG0_00880 [Vulcanimicrobiaceae bacterium]|nr:hypothetical protein [Bacillota bacterium]